MPPYGMQVATIVNSKGMDFSFDVNAMIDWSWLEMVAQLDDGSMTDVVGVGLVRCEFAACANSYDYKMHHANRMAGRAQGPQLRVWDFVLWRADGTASGFTRSGRRRKSKRKRWNPIPSKCNVPTGEQGRTTAQARTSITKR